MKPCFAPTKTAILCRAEYILPAEYAKLDATLEHRKLHSHAGAWER